MKRHYVWYSLCSAHREIDPQCTVCHAGMWVDEADPAWIADQQLFRNDPEAWRAKHNPGTDTPCGNARPHRPHSFRERISEWRWGPVRHCPGRTGFLGK